MNKYIATRKLLLKKPGGEKIKIELNIGLPYKKDNKTWECPIQLEGLYENLANSCGEDSFQALMLAQNLAKTLLNDFVKKGGKIYCFDEKYKIEINKLFQSGV